ncbi:acyltransferase family protein [Enterobacter oligotrophicus]
MLRNYHPSYRPDIDGLRAFAVVPVVLFHAFPSMIPGGFIGVDIFFVISGYLISSIIFKSVQSGSFSFADFYMKRANRIFPTLSLVLATCLAFGWFSLYSDEYMQLGKHTAAGAGFVANIVLLMESGYFDNSSDTKVLLHLWSLGIEEQFYLLWPILILLFKRSKKAILFVLLSVIAMSFIANIYYIKVDPTVTYYSPLTRFWELAFGALLAYKGFHYRSNNTSARKIHHAMSIVGFVIIISSIFFVTKTDFPGWKAVLPVAGAFLIIGAGHDAIVNRYVLSLKPIIFIGLISYPLYLWHWPIFTFLRIIDSGEVSGISMLTAVACAFLFSVITYLCWERPIRYSSKKSITAVLLTAVIAILGGIGYTIFSTGGAQNRHVVEVAKERNYQLNTHNWKYMTNDICLSRYPFPDAKDYKWFFCYMTRNDKPEILLLGNSYANHLYYGLHKSDYFKNKNILSIGTCVPNIPDTSDLTGNHPCAGDRPGKQRELIQGIIEKEKSIKFVIISGLFWNNSMSAEKRLEDYIDFIIKNGAKPILLYPHVYPGFDTKACFSRPFSDPVKSCHFGIEAYKEKVDGVEGMFQRIKEKYPQVKFYNPNSMYCDERGCDFIQSGMPMFRDTGHFSFYGSRKVIDGMVKWAKSNDKDLLN